MELTFLKLAQRRGGGGGGSEREREAKKIEAAERSLGGWWRVDGGNGSLGIALSISGPLCNPPLLTPVPTLGNRRLHSIPFHPFSTAENHPRNSPFLLPPPPPSAAREGRGGREGVPLARKLYPHSRRRAARLSLSLARSPLAISLSVAPCSMYMHDTYVYMYICMYAWACVQVWKLRLFSFRNFSLPIFTFSPSPLFLPLRSL